MSTDEKLRKEIIQRFGDAYKAFGLNKLMGHIVALLIYSPEPLSLGEIAQHLGRSKGPVSQILRRLRDRKLIRKAWTSENNRKDYYEIEPEIFENAFRNNFDLIKNNRRIASLIRNRVEEQDKDDYETLSCRIQEMERFYELMEKHFSSFLAEWSQERDRFHAKKF